MMNSFVLFVMCGVAACVADASAFLSPLDTQRLRTVFESTLHGSSDSVSSLHYAIMGLKLSGGGERKEPLQISQEICNKLKAKLEGKSEAASIIADIHMASAAASANCKPALTDKVKQVIASSVTGPTVSSIYHGVLASSAMGISIDSDAVAKALSTALKKDDSLTSLGMAFNVAASLPKLAVAQQFFDRVEDALVQADEIDGNLLQFEGGLTVTSSIIVGSLELGAKVGKPLPITKSQVVKFSNYFVSRKTVTSAKGAYHLLHVLNSLVDNYYAVPVAITLASTPIISGASPNIRVRVTDLLGRPFADKMTVTLDSADQVSGKAGIISNVQMTGVAGETSMFETNMMSVKPGNGFYTLTVSAKPVKANDRLVGHTGVTLNVKVLASVMVDKAEIGIIDADQSSPAKMEPLFHPDKLKKGLKADSHHKLTMKFSLKNKETKGAIDAHQVFVRFSLDKSEIIFLAEKSSSSNYKFQLDVNAKAMNFGSRSGKYKMELIVGDAIISNPLVWNFAEISLEFPDSVEVKAAPGVKPEIRHMFRQPEVRPSILVSNTFTLLCLAPLVLMIALWIKLGLGFTTSLFNISSIGFHLGLGAIFLLYYYFWIQINMFTTVKYLLILGVFTFLCGNSMLVQLAEQRKC